MSLVLALVQELVLAPAGHAAPVRVPQGEVMVDSWGIEKGMALAKSPPRLHQDQGIHI